ncbi:MAG: accessory factor UbiK family protein [Pseudomonadota bacterium]
MQVENPFLDGVARVMTEAAGAANGVREEAETLMRRQMERLTADMDLVPREEFDAMRDVAAAARAESERLSDLVAALEARVAALEGRAGS